MNVLGGGQIHFTGYPKKVHYLYAHAWFFSLYLNYFKAKHFGIFDLQLIYISVIEDYAKLGEGVTFYLSAIYFFSIHFNLECQKY